MFSSFLKKFLLTLAIAPVFLSQPVLAHVVWFEPINENKYELLFGHPESGPELLNPDKFEEATAYDLDKNVIPSTITLEDGRLFLTAEGQVGALTAFYDNGYWLRNPDGSSTNISQEQAAAIGYENVSNFVKYAKSLYSWSEALSTPFGLPIEIIALENPLALQEGDNLPIQVLFQGNLITNPLVEYLGGVVSVDSSGIALIPIGADGLQVIEASYTDPGAINPMVSYAATLTAEAVPEPLTIIGVGTAIGFGTFFKRELLKKSKNKTNA